MSSGDRARDPLGLDAQTIRLANQLDETTDENVRLREANTAAHEAGVAVEVERARLEQECERLREALREYGRHQEGCNAQWGDRYRCRCGWREVEAGLEAERHAS